MATFPDVLATTYLPSSTPVVKSVDLNAMQAEHVRAWRALRGNDFLLFDDFAGGQLDLGIWLPPSASVASGVSFGDSVAGALGVVKLAPPAAGSLSLSTSPLPLGTLDWRLAVRARFPNYNALTIAAECQIGLLNPFVVTDCNFFRIKRLATGAATITAYSATATENDTRVAVPADAYSTFEIRRVGTTVTFIINDVPVFTTAYTLAVQAAPIFLNCSTPSGLQLYADFMKFWAVRQPVSSATG